MVVVIFNTRGNSLNAGCPGLELLIVSLMLKLVFHPGELRMRPCRWFIFKGLVKFVANALWVHSCLPTFTILGPSRAQPLGLLPWGFSLGSKVHPAHVQQEQSLPTIGRGWWINAPAPSPLGWIPQGPVFYTVIHSPRSKSQLLTVVTYLVTHFPWLLCLLGLTSSCLACPGIPFQINYLPLNHCSDSPAETQLKASVKSNVQPLGAARVCV